MYSSVSTYSVSDPFTCSLDKVYLVNGATAVADKVNSKTIPQHVKYFWLSNYIEQISR
jgi:hypothetical protein